MISILKNSCILSLLLVTLLWPGVLLAQTQNSLALSVTPTLFEMSANPEQSWQSSVKVINSNPFPITIYASALNFAPQGEVGQGKLIPVIEEMTEGATLAEWITVTDEPLTIEPEQSLSVPLTVQVPKDASPGGHFAAIMISTQSPESQGQRLAVRTSQAVTSLFFVRVAGDVVEDGSIRSFVVEEGFLQAPEAEFVLRFENNGNVHLQPRGEIKIFNMWGKERGRIPINERTHFGNVLPNSIRAFQFTWTGEQSITDIGRYKVLVTLGYGEGSTKFASASTHFWVVPIKSLLITLGAVFLVLFVIMRAVKLYVRHMLQLAGVQPAKTQYRSRLETANDLEISRYQTITTPMTAGIKDVISKLSDTTKISEFITVAASLVVKYRLFLLFVVFAFGIMFVLHYFVDDVTEDKDYTIAIDNPDTTTSLNAEEVQFNERTGAYIGDTLPEAAGQPFSLTLTNTSGVSGSAAAVAARLFTNEYVISALITDTSRINTNTVIVFDPALSESALQLSRELGGALLSARTSTSSEELPNITIFVGEDQLLD